MRVGVEEEEACVRKMRMNRGEKTINGREGGAVG